MLLDVSFDIHPLIYYLQAVHIFVLKIYLSVQASSGLISDLHRFPADEQRRNDAAYEV